MSLGTLSAVGPLDALSPSETEKASWNVILETSARTLGELGIGSGKQLISGRSLEDHYDDTLREKYIAMILTNDRATRQNDGTYETKTYEEWEKIDKAKEENLRDMPKNKLFKMGEELEDKLEARYEELTEKEIKHTDLDNIDKKKNSNINPSKDGPFDAER